MKRLFCAVAAAVLLLLSACGSGGKTEAATEWDCSVHCAEESRDDAYVITWSDAAITSATGAITFQNRNDFPITVHLSGGGKEVYSAEVQPGGVLVYLQAERDIVYTAGIHADVEEGTELKLMVYDGERSDVY